MTLERLAKQTMPADDYEVIVIDDGSPDDTLAVLEREGPRLPFELTVLHHSNRGPGYTQNRGIRAARAPLVLLIADDIWLEPQALAEHYRSHMNEPVPEVAVLGKVVQSPDIDQSVFLRTWEPFRFRELDRRDELPYTFFWACNISFKRAFMLECGMFREPMGRAGAAAHEDVELGYRLSQKGLRLLYNRRALGEHYHVVTLEGAIQRAYQRGMNWREFTELVPTPEVIVEYHILSLETLADYLKAWFGPGRRHLFGINLFPPLLILYYLVRSMAFNKLTLMYLWLPLFRRAETSPPYAKMVRHRMYQGVIAWSFRKGIRDARRIFNARDHREPGRR